MKIALIGTGGMGGSHIEAYPYVKGLEVAAVADTCLENAEKHARKLGCAAYRTLDEMLAHSSPDAVDICVPSFLHTEFSLRCMERGLNVFCEKPMAHSCADADRMIEAARKNNVKLMVGQVLRYWPEYRYLQARIKDERFGRLRYLSLTRQYGMHPEGSWYLNPDLCKMVCFEMHIHDTDMVNYLFGKPDALSSVGWEQPDIHMSYINTHYIYRDRGVAVVAQGGWNNSTLPFAGGYLAAFERGCVEYRDGVVTCYEAGREPYPAKLETLAGVPSDIVGVYEELTEFSNLVAGKIAATTVPPESARDTIFLVEKECQALLEGRPVELA